MQGLQSDKEKLLIQSSKKARTFKERTYMDRRKKILAVVFWIDWKKRRMERPEKVQLSKQTMIRIWRRVLAMSVKEKDNRSKCS